MAGEEALALVQGMRPVPAVDVGVITPGAHRRTRETILTTADGRDVPADALSVNPGNPAYRSMIPPPPCAACGADHNPVGEARNQYGHPYLDPKDVPDGADLTVLQAHDVPPPAEQMPYAVQGSPPPVPATQRVSIYASRRDEAFIVNVEKGPDWDIEEGGTFKLTEDELLPVLPLLRKLGVKIKDNTGEISALEMERNDAREHDSTHGRGAPAVSGRGTRRGAVQSEGPGEGE